MGDESLHVAVVDIGRLANLGWVVEGPSINRSGTDIDSCVEALAEAVTTGPLALGFEAPMFVPFGRDRRDLDRARAGEGDRAFAAAAGACSLTKGLVIVPYILAGLRRLAGHSRPTFKWREDLRKNDLLLFEAFVAHVGNFANHQECARLAISNFPKDPKERALFESAVPEPCTLNLLGAMLLRIGWAADPALLSEPCLVVSHFGGA